MSGYFITGTDTGCGKTRVGCAIASELRKRGQRVRVLKPIETGCAEDASGTRIAADARALAEAADDTREADAICPYRLALPAAPEIAARDEGVRIELGALVRAYRSAASAADVVLVEGAGGLRVPIAPGLDMCGLAAALDLPLIVVARASLGTINHTQLTLDSALRAGLRVRGVVISHTVPDPPAAEMRNLALLIESLPVPLLGELHHGAEHLEPALPL